MGQLKYKAYLRRRFQPVEKQKVFLLKTYYCYSVTIMRG